jgi:hypothetical protein
MEVSAVVSALHGPRPCKWFVPVNSGPESRETTSCTPGVKQGCKTGKCLVVIDGLWQPRAFAAVVSNLLKPSSFLWGRLGAAILDIGYLMNKPGR